MFRPNPLAAALANSDYEQAEYLLGAEPDFIEDICPGDEALKAVLRKNYPMADLLFKAAPGLMSSISPENQVLMALVSFTSVQEIALGYQSKTAKEYEPILRTAVNILKAVDPMTLSTVLGYIEHNIFFCKTEEGTEFMTWLAEQLGMSKPISVAAVSAASPLSVAEEGTISPTSGTTITDSDSSPVASEHALYRTAVSGLKGRDRSRRAFGNDEDFRALAVSV